MATRVICYGLGPIGLMIARLALTKPGIQIVGAVDSDQTKAGRDLGELLGSPPIGVTINTNPTAILKSIQPDVVLHATGSSLAYVTPQLVEIAHAGADVVSICEELAYPWTAQPQLAAELDGVARRSGVTLLGTGINPGYIMDALPLMLTAPCASIQSIHIRRIVDVAQRSKSLQRKVGAGLSREEFDTSVQAGRVRHVGLTESLHMLATSLGWHLENNEYTIEPIMAQESMTTPAIQVAAGQVAGIRQVARGFMNGQEVLALELDMYVGAPDPQDVVEIDGEPPLRMTIAGGIQDDIAAAAIVVNAVPSVIQAAPGLASMSELPLIHFS